MAGEHNALNATAAAALAAGQGVSKEAICRGAGELQEREAAAGGARARSAASRSSTILRIIRRRFARRCARCGRVYPQARLWAVLEPRSNTLRRKVLESDLVASLRLADRVVLAGVYQQQRIPEAERLHPEDVVRALNAAGTRRPSSARMRKRS